MFTAADLIEALQRRLQLTAPFRRRAPGEFPPGWQRWFASMQSHGDAITGAPAQTIIEVLLQRPLAQRPRSSGELTRWQAFGTLWRQEWHRPEPEDRKVRWFSAAFTVLWHVFFIAMLLWLMYSHFRALEDEASKRRGEEEVVQIEFIGRGTPQEAGGGAAQPAPQDSQAPAGEDSTAAPADVATEAPAQPPIDASVPEIEQREDSEPRMPSPVAEQNVAVSAPTPETTDFVLPAPAPRITPPQLAVPELAAPTRELEAVEVPEPVQPIRREVLQVQITAPRIDAPIPEVTQRELTAPVPRPQLREIEVPPLAQPTVRTPDVTVRPRDIPAPKPRASAPVSASTPATPTPAQTTPPADAAASGKAASGPRPSDKAPTAVTAGQGPKPLPAPGRFTTPPKADDWGASTRNVPGGQKGEPTGLYNAEGGPRLTQTPINTGQPPGTLDDRIVDLDRSGTWLKRKPTDYEPTTFDKYWRPNETLLQEWVRKGIKKMSIPIPGTNKKIECLVSMLALGGGCGISDPNLNEQPATARPPPDIPFKPHLQEDNGSVTPSSGG